MGRGGGGGGRGAAAAVVSIRHVNTYILCSPTYVSVCLLAA